MARDTNSRQRTDRGARPATAVPALTSHAGAAAMAESGERNERQPPPPNPPAPWNHASLNRVPTDPSISPPPPPLLLPPAKQAQLYYPSEPAVGPLCHGVGRDALRRLCLSASELRPCVWTSLAEKLELGSVWLAEADGGGCVHSLGPDEPLILASPFVSPLVFENEASDARDHCANERSQFCCWCC